ncbi:glycosyl hydrolase [Glaciecola sp. HTCC2999]|uniref:glycosyl hydrolase n=1 Tax=Glaciecola sp. HTCC2999 TaxID=455436 RepID=UPI0000E11064|nr:glycosyl hydrolase [Glaciecola sp. HTCC2999]
MWKKLLCSGVLSFFLTPNVFAGQLNAEYFAKPTAEYLPKTWMHAMNGNLSKPGFTGDFQALSDAGIGGAIFFHVHRKDRPYSSRGPVRFGTDEFFEHLVHAAAQADKHDIEFGIHNADGWTSSGGPWVSPEQSMKRITWSETNVSGPQKMTPAQPGYYEGLYRDIAIIALPENKYNQSNQFANARLSSSDLSLNTNVLQDKDWDTTFTFNKNDDDDYWVQVTLDKPATLRSLHIETPNRHGDASLQISQDGKKFITVDKKLRRPRPGARLWAFSPQLVTKDQDGYTAKYFRIVFDKPITLTRFDLWSVPRIDDWYSMNSMERGRLSLAPQISSHAITALDDVVVLHRGEIPEQGINVPDGQWRVLRFGYTSTGAKNVPSSTEGKGLEVDKFDAQALRFHFDQYVGKFAKQLKAKNINSLKTTEIDSYGVGGQNWTSNIDKSFSAKFGYDFIPWLPAMTGRVIESPRHTGAVLQEYRQHLSNLMVDNYFGEFTRIANEYGMESYIEPYGWGPFDELAAGGKADRLMGEFWVKAPYGEEQRYHSRVEAAISSAHTYGRNIVSAESFTSTQTNWYGHPYYYKHHGDHMWARGINETMFHRFAHQPNNHIRPGMTMDSIGSHIDRTQTWWLNGGSKWFEYLARGSYLLQQGVPDADFLVHIGDVAPLRVTKRLQVPEGFKFDHVNTDVLINRAKVENGLIVLPEGTRYRAIVLNRTDFLNFHTIKRIQELVAQGATVIGKKPESVIGFSELPKQAEFTSIVDKLWGDSKEGLNRFKLGTVSSFSLEESISKLGLAADLIIDEQPVKYFAKRRIGKNTLYYFHNDEPVFKHINIDFKDGDGQPEIWNVDDGSVEPILNYTRSGNRLKTKLALEPYGGRFVLIRRDEDAPKYEGTYTRLIEDTYLNKDQGRIINTLNGPWSVRFDTALGGPEQVEFDQLVNWIDSNDDRVKYFSGTAKYENSFSLNTLNRSEKNRIYLDLGEVQQIAEVKINGKSMPTLWKPPFVLDITDVVELGENQLTVAVTNTWVNRLIGDEALPDTSGYSMVGDTVAWLNNNEPPPKSERVTFTGFNFFERSNRRKLQSSGLLGPVNVFSVSQNNLKGSHNE